MANAMQQWQAKAAETLAVAGNLVNRLPELERLYTANGLAELIEATEPGAVVAGGTLTKERLVELAGLFDAFATWLNTPPAENAALPILVLSRVD